MFKYIFILNTEFEFIYYLASYKNYVGITKQVMTDRQFFQTVENIILRELNFGLMLPGIKEFVIN